MPGLVGIASSHPRAAIGEELERMVAAVRYFDWYTVDQMISPRRMHAIAHVHLNVLPTERWLHGEEHDGFTRAVFDEAAQSLTIINDQFGMMPLYYTFADGGLIFGTELKAVLAHPGVSAQLDLRGLADYLAFGFLFGEKTLARGVQCLPGGSRLRFDGRTGELTLERTWDFRRQIRCSARDDLDDVGKALQAAVRKRCEGGVQVGVSLSDGYDSRIIQGAIDHRQYHIQTLMLGARSRMQKAIGAKISRQTNGLENYKFVEIDAMFRAQWPACIRETVWLSDGMYYDDYIGILMYMVDRFRQLGTQVVLRGHGGELAKMGWAGDLSCNRMIRRCRTQADVKAQLFSQMCIGLTDTVREGLFVPEVAQSLRGAARASLEEAFAGVEAGWHPIDQVSCVYVQEYLRRQCVPSLAQLRSRTEVRLPLLDASYVAALMELAPECRLGRGIHRYLLAKSNPALLRIPIGYLGAPAGASDLTHGLYWKTKQLLNKYFRDQGHFLGPRSWLYGPLRQHVEAVLLDKRTLTRGLFQPDALRAAVKAYNWTRVGDDATLFLLFCMELWFRMFIDREPWQSC